MIQAYFRNAHRWNLDVIEIMAHDQHLPSTNQPNVAEHMSAAQVRTRFSRI
jgi:hypothetical protein